MQLKATLALLAAAAGSVTAQRPEDVPPCDYYTKALLMENTAENQLALLTQLVNTAVIGNYTMPNMNAVPGILTPGTYEGTQVNLLKYFDGSLKSTNANGKAVSVNFLDGGGATPLTKNMPANDEDSAQYALLTHLYSYFGVLLGCSMVGTSGFPAYAGSNSQGSVHRFMVLDENEVGYFIMNVGLAAASFGVTEEDVTAVGDALTKTFDYRCSPPAVVVPEGGKQLQSICQADSCPLDPNAMCSAYPTEPEPVPVGSGPAPSGGASPTGGSGGGSGGGATPSVPPATSLPAAPTGSNAAVVGGANLAAVAGAAVLAFAL